MKVILQHLSNLKEVQEILQWLTAKTVWQQSLKAASLISNKLTWFIDKSWAGPAT